MKKIRAGETVEKMLGIYRIGELSVLDAGRIALKLFENKSVAEEGAEAVFLRVQKNIPLPAEIKRRISSAYMSAMERAYENAKTESSRGKSFENLLAASRFAMEHPEYADQETIRRIADFLISKADGERCILMLDMNSRRSTDTPDADTTVIFKKMIGETLRADISRCSDYAVNVLCECISRILRAFPASETGDAVFEKGVEILKRRGEHAEDLLKYSSSYGPERYAEMFLRITLGIPEGWDDPKAAAALEKHYNSDLLDFELREASICSAIKTGSRYAAVRILSGAFNFKNHVEILSSAILSSKKPLGENEATYLFHGAYKNKNLDKISNLSPETGDHLAAVAIMSGYLEKTAGYVLTDRNFEERTTRVINASGRLYGIRGVLRSCEAFYKEAEKIDRAKGGRTSVAEKIVSKFWETAERYSLRDKEKERYDESFLSRIMLEASDNPPETSTAADVFLATDMIRLTEENAAFSGYARMVVSASLCGSYPETEICL